LCLFDCEPEELNHDDFKDSNFKDDGQLEIATWPPNLKYLYLPYISKSTTNIIRIPMAIWLVSNNTITVMLPNGK